MAGSNPEPAGVERHGAILVPLDKNPSVNRLANRHLAGERHSVLFELLPLKWQVQDTEPLEDLRYELKGGPNGKFGTRLPVWNRSWGDLLLIGRRRGGMHSDMCTRLAI